MHLTGLCGVLSVVVLLPWLLERQLSRIARTDRWQCHDELKMFGNFYVAFKRKWFRFFLVQHFIVRIEKIKRRAHG